MNLLFGFDIYFYSFHHSYLTIHIQYIVHHQSCIQMLYRQIVSNAYCIILTDNYVNFDQRAPLPQKVHNLLSWKLNILRIIHNESPSPVKVYFDFPLRKNTLYSDKLRYLLRSICGIIFITDIYQQECHCKYVLCTCNDKY